MTRKIVTFGPGPRFKGGIANYNTSLARAFDKLDNTEVHIVSWTQQYPAIIPRDFIDRKSRKDQLEGTNIRVHYVTNYNSPPTWRKTYHLIKEIDPEMVIFQWSIAIQGLPLGRIAKWLKKTGIEVIMDLHFVIQKEGSSIDNYFTRLGISHADTYIVHSLKTCNELKELFPRKNLVMGDRERPPLNEGETGVIKLYHPVYDMFKPDPEFDIEKQKKELGLNKYVFLFFGFIRKYKGLHNVIKAFAKVAKERDDVSLLIVGEAFWQTLDTKKFSTKLKQGLFGIAKSVFLRKQDDEREYRPLELIDQLDIKDKVVPLIEFVPNEDVHRYFQVSDYIMLYYLTATPSGVESIAYNFRLPILATRVGHFPETVKDCYNGYLAEPENIESMASAIRMAIEEPIDRNNVAETSADMSWENYARAIIG